jgi:hypothetical protein
VGVRSQISVVYAQTCGAFERVQRYVHIIQAVNVTDTSLALLRLGLLFGFLADFIVHFVEGRLVAEVVAAPNSHLHAY